MKLRLKISGQRRLIDLGDTDASSLTLGALKASVSETFQIERGNVELSLNKADVLSGDELPIADVGIVPGDLVHVITDGEVPDNPASRQERPQPLASHNQSCSAVDQMDTNQHNANDDEPTVSENIVAISEHTSSATSNSASLNDGPEIEEHGSADSIQSSMLEPFVIRESTIDQVPALLQELYSGSDITCPNDALFILLHVLMIESGFCLPENADISRLPPDWKRPGFYICMYQYVLTPGMVSDCSLMAVPTGSSMAVHGLSKTVGAFKTDHLQVKAENFVRDISQVGAAAAYRSLDRLTNMFKDTIGQALQNHLATSAGFRETQGLLSLPCEVRMRLMCFLDAKSVCALGQTCQQWKSIYKDNTVWRRLYINSFERPEDTSLSRNWYEMFKERYQQYLVQQEHRRRFFAIDDDFGLPHPHNPFAPHFNPERSFFPPRFLGGEHDLDPQFFAGTGLPRIPRQGMRSPYNPSMSQGRGRIGKGRGNLTGSPFFNGGRFL